MNFAKFLRTPFLQNISGRLLLKLASNERRGKGTKSLRCNQTPYQNKLTLEFRIDGILRLLIISFFATLPNLIKHFPFINFGEFCQPPRLFRPPLLFETGEYKNALWEHIFAK